MEKDKEKHRPVVFHVHPDLGLTLQSGMCPDQELNSLPFSLRDDIQIN